MAEPAPALHRRDFFRNQLRFTITSLNSEGGNGLIGDFLAAGFEHGHFLVFHPRDASPAKLKKRTDAGWGPDAIVTLSQLVAFLAFQIRTITGLRALAAA